MGKGRGFCLAVTDQYFGTVHIVHHPLHQRGWTGGTSHNSCTQTGQLELRESRVFQFRNEHGGYAMDGATTLAVHCL